MSSKEETRAGSDIVAEVSERIRKASNVLIALSKDPSIDELSAALGLSLILDKLNKRATAIFSGKIPNIIEFLQPEKTFEENTDSLQDFIVSLNAEKADHLRYKIEGDFVKVFFTPYRKETITEKDLQFSHGDFNVDLIISLNITDVSQLDDALREYGRIKHDASSINISAAAPGKFGDVEWGDPSASSICEMVVRLSYDIQDPDEPVIDDNVATTLLTGIIAATNRFSNERTSADTMSVASNLMISGANQQLIAKNIPVDILTKQPEPIPEPEEKKEEEKPAEAPEEKKEEKIEETPKAEEAPKPKEPEEPKDPTSFSIEHKAKPEKTEEPKLEEAKLSEPEKKPVENDAKAETERIVAEQAAKREAEKAAAEEKRRKEEAERKAREDEERAKSEAAKEEVMAKLIAERNESEKNAGEGSAKRDLLQKDKEVLPPEPPKDYASMISSELKNAGGQPAYVPASVDDAPTLTSEVSVAPSPAAHAEPTAKVETKGTPIVKAEVSQDGILPPPPAPVGPSFMPPALPIIDISTPAPAKTEEKPATAAPTAPVSFATPKTEATTPVAKETKPEPVMPTVKMPFSAPVVQAQNPTPAPAPAAAAPAQSFASSTPAAMPGQTTPATPAPTPKPAPTTPASSNPQADPGAFHIPGM